MQPVPHVLTQVVLLLVVFGLDLAARGDAIAFASVVILGIGAVLTTLFALVYHWRRRARMRAGHPISFFRRRDDRRMAALSLVGYGIPIGFGATMVAGVHVRGILFHTSQAATVASLLLIATFVAVLTSSAVDWYLITPFQRGVLNATICCTGTDGPDVQTRRAYAKWWVVHRGICELISYTSAALFVAIVGAALTEQVKADGVLQIAFGSFIGAGTAVWLAAYLQRRIVAAWEFMQEQSVGLGRWAEGANLRDAPIAGFVRDVSVSPGIQLCSAPDDPEFVPLKYAPMAQDQEPPWPLCSSSCERWVELCDEHFRQQESVAAALSPVSTS
jgi:hypothetical protein